MIKLVGLWVVGGALCVTPVAADEGVYDGPTAIRPLRKPQPQHSVQPNPSATSSISATREGWTRGLGSRGSPGHCGQAHRAPSPSPR